MSESSRKSDNTVNHFIRVKKPLFFYSDVKVLQNTAMDNISLQNHVEITKLSPKIMNFIEYTFLMKFFSVHNA
jgi:hypothetical protein